MGKNKNQARMPFVTGEDVYFGLPQDRPKPEINDLCWVLIDGDLHKSRVYHTTECFFYAEVVEGEKKGMVTLPPGIRNEKFRPVD